MIFISHSHKDQPLAEGLVEYLLASLEIEPKALRCTSVPGHQLPFGQTISEQLKADIHASAAIFVLLTETSLQSSWVMFELGASWALGRIVVPILGLSVKPTSLPGPLLTYPYLAIESNDATERMSDAIAQIATALTLAERTGGKREAKLRAFLRAAQSRKAVETTPDIKLALAFEIPWLIQLIASDRARHPVSVYTQIRHHMARLGITARMPVESYIQPGDQGRGAMTLIEELGGGLRVQHPQLMSTFECGANLILHVSRGQQSDLLAAVERLPIPNELKVPQQDLVSWFNEIHNYFDRRLLAEVTT